MKKYLSDSAAVLLRKEREREKLKRFARKITKVPESIRVYSNPLMKKERERET